SPRHSRPTAGGRPPARRLFPSPRTTPPTARRWPHPPPRRPRGALTNLPSHGIRRREHDDEARAGRVCAPACTTACSSPLRVRRADVSRSCVDTTTAETGGLTVCGIAGKLWFDPSRVVEAGQVRRMCNALAHRGPDDEGVYTRGPVGLGHRRLSILDLSAAGHQPM